MSDCPWPSQMWKKQNNTSCLSISNSKCPILGDSCCKKNPLVMIKGTHDTTVLMQQSTKYSKEEKSTSISLNTDTFFSQMNQLNWRVFSTCCLNISVLTCNFKGDQGGILNVGRSFLPAPTLPMKIVENCCLTILSREAARSDRAFFPKLLKSIKN